MRGRSNAPKHLNVEQAEWEVSASYPEGLRRVLRWKILIGSGGPDWQPGVPQEDVLVGVLELDAGGYYPAHSHPAPEIYFVISGTAEWTVGEETFTAGPGMAIYHSPNVLHRMLNNGSEPLRTVWFWWAPGGRKDVLQVGAKLLE